MPTLPALDAEGLQKILNRLVALERQVAGLPTDIVTPSELSARLSTTSRPIALGAARRQKSNLGYDRRCFFFEAIEDIPGALFNPPGGAPCAWEPGRGMAVRQNFSTENCFSGECVDDANCSPETIYNPNCTPIYSGTRFKACRQGSDPWMADPLNCVLLGVAQSDADAGEVIDFVIIAPDGGSRTLQVMALTAFTAGQTAEIKSDCNCQLVASCGCSEPAELCCVNGAVPSCAIVTVDGVSNIASALCDLYETDWYLRHQGFCIWRNPVCPHDYDQAIQLIQGDTNWEIEGRFFFGGGYYVFRHETSVPIIEPFECEDLAQFTLEYESTEGSPTECLMGIFSTVEVAFSNDACIPEECEYECPICDTMPAPTKIRVRLSGVGPATDTTGDIGGNPIWSNWDDFNDTFDLLVDASQSNVSGCTFRALGPLSVNQHDSCQQGVLFFSPSQVQTEIILKSSSVAMTPDLELRLGFVSIENCESALTCLSGEAILGEGECSELLPQFPETYPTQDIGSSACFNFPDFSNATFTILSL